MKRHFFISLLLLNGCSTVSSKVERTPAEVTSLSEEGYSDTPGFQEKTLLLFRSIEIPKESSYKKNNLKIFSDSCEVKFKKSSDGGTQVHVDFGFDPRIDGTFTGVVQLASGLPATACPNGICEFQS